MLTNWYKKSTGRRSRPASAAAAAALSLLLIAASLPSTILLLVLGAPYSAQAGVTVKPQNIVATGGTITTVSLGNTVYKVHTFTSTTTPDTFRVTSGSGKAEVLVVAGGAIATL